MDGGRQSEPKRGDTVETMAEKSGLTIIHFQRRKYPRINIRLAIEYTILDSPDQSMTKSATIGGGGLMLYLPTAVPIGSVLELVILLPDHMKIPCTVRVVWTELLTGLEKDDFKTGVAFEQVTEHELEMFRKFIKEHQNPYDIPTSLSRDDVQ